ncbi:MAG: aminotransferase class V-fold PLP-dependent enzyme, partial [Acidimicrobiales bacterium]
MTAPQHPGTGPADGSRTTLDVSRIKKDFPILDITVHGDKRLVFLDSAASAQRPNAVLEAMDHYYLSTHANVHRGVYATA